MLNLPVGQDWPAGDPEGVADTRMSANQGLVSVFTDSDARDRFGRKAFAEFLASAHPDWRVVVVDKADTTEWGGGRRRTGTAVTLWPALLDLMAQSVAVVDLHPGRLAARRVLASMLVGTPVVVPADSRARTFCEHSGGGLWFNNPGQLLWSVEALCDPAVRSDLARQGQAYCRAHHSSSEQFAQELFAALDTHSGGDGPDSVAR
jgi:hypothetical protein